MGWRDGERIASAHRVTGLRAGQDQLAHLDFETVVGRDAVLVGTGDRVGLLRLRLSSVERAADHAGTAVEAESGRQRRRAREGIGDYAGKVRQRHRRDVDCLACAQIVRFDDLDVDCETCLLLQPAVHAGVHRRDRVSVFDHRICAAGKKPPRIRVQVQHAWA